jgi:hypothetical protein
MGDSASKLLCQGFAAIESELKELRASRTTGKIFFPK